MTAALDPIGRAAAMDGVLMLSFILALPAAELMLPLAASGYALTGMGMPAFSPVTCMAVILFTMFHWPCATTVLTIRKETGSLKWTALGILLPTAVGITACALITLLTRLII